jgi:hypothetical protein
MNITELETKLTIKIKDAEPTLDVTGADKKVLYVAFQDLQSYLKFIAAPASTTNPDCSETPEQPLQQDPAEIDSFLTVWTGLWLKKWKERFNLVIGANSQPAVGQTSEKAEKTESLWFQLACRYELTEIVVSSLIRNSEICGATIIAENLLKSELGKQKDQDVNSKAQTLALLNNVLRRARELSQRTGPVVSIKVDKNYYCQVTN